MKKITEYLIGGLLIGAAAGLIASISEPWFLKNIFGEYGKKIGGHLSSGEHHDYTFSAKSNSLITLELPKSPSFDSKKKTNPSYTIQIFKSGDNFDNSRRGLVEKVNNCETQSPDDQIFCSAGYGGENYVLSKYVKNGGEYVIRLTTRSGKGLYYSVFLDISDSRQPYYSNDSRFDAF